MTKATLHGLFHEAAEKYSENSACEFYDESLNKASLTYEGVCECADEIKKIVTNVVSTFKCPEKVTLLTTSFNVGLYLDTNVFIPSLVIGILSAGHHFLPLSLTSPTGVIHDLIEKTATNYIITRPVFVSRLLEALPPSKAKCTDTIPFKLSSNGSKVVNFVLCNFQSGQEDNSKPKKHFVDLAYVLSTSGTTGDPKVVHVPNSCIVPNILHLRHIFQITSSDKVVMCSPLTFDPSIVEMFITLSSGATLLTLADQIKQQPSKFLYALFDVSKVTVMQATPALFSRFKIPDLRNIVFSAESSLRLVAFGGEACPSYKTIKSWFNQQVLVSPNGKIANLQFFNLYGITEVSSWASITEISWNNILHESDWPISLGYPLFETVLDIVDDCNALLCQILNYSPPNSTDYDSSNESLKNCYIKLSFPRACFPKESEFKISGYLRIGGSKRVCYMQDCDENYQINLRNNLIMRNTGDVVSLCIDCAKADAVKEVTEELSFLKLGCAEGYGLYYEGRTDKQIKRSGKRLSLLLIEKTLEKLPFVSIAHVTVLYPHKLKISARPQSTFETNNPFLGEKEKLVAFLVVFGKQVMKHDIFQYLRKVLEAHCVPDEIVFVDEMPITYHGKIDGRTLLHDFIKNRKNENLSCNTLRNVTATLKECWNTALDLVTEKQSLNYKVEENLLKLNFIEQGGDSFKAVKLLSILTDELPDLDLLSFPTLLDTILHRTFSDINEVLLKRRICKTKNHVSHCDEEHNNRKRFSKEEKQLNNKLKKVLHNDIDSVNKSSFSCTSLTRGGVTRLHGMSRDGKELFLPLHNSLKLKKFTSIENMTFGLRESWSFNTGKCIDASPLISFNNLRNIRIAIIGSHSFLLAAVDISNGDVIWQRKLGGRIESSACLTPCGQYVVVGCYDHFVYVLAVTNGNVFWKFQTGDQVKCSPCPGPRDTSIVFIGSHDRYLYCLDVKDQNVLWKYHAGAFIFSSPHYNQSYDDYMKSTLFGCALSGKVFSLCPHNGHERWAVNVGKPIFSSPRICTKGLCCGCVDSSFYMLSSENGNILWKFSTNQPIFSSAAVSVLNPGRKEQSSTDEVVVFGSHDGSVYCVNSSDGKLKWSYKVDSDEADPSPVYSTPFVSTLAVTDKELRIVSVASTSGRLVILSLRSGRCMAQTSLAGHVFSSPVVIGCESAEANAHNAICDVLVGCRNDYFYSFQLCTRV